jgi:2-succinyl-5-enolpyruvyl-6-hydroxy-3-cyclohexene-1-carboxylate synthase
MAEFTRPESLEQPLLLEVVTNKNKDARLLKEYYYQLRQK